MAGLLTIGGDLVLLRTAEVLGRLRHLGTRKRMRALVTLAQGFPV